ncbi:hypothetical protein [Faunimonas pinastri]|uniref:hypothetical protein n=1 Tax=Faunimonas pinastri TaxID=1855383 RepID=UPI0015A5A230|nr:hypothetical protein [Faunimonas pinastri]
MPRYEPLDAGVPLKASGSDLVAFQWQINGISADFSMADDEAHLLRVSFHRPCIVRLLDELPLSTEEDETPKEGLVPEHFAYRLDGARFARHQSEAWKYVFGPVAHYQFVTGDTCMDMLSGGSPSFSIVDRAGGLSLPAQT